MSVAAHVALVAAAAAATTSAGRVGDPPRPPEVVDIVYTVHDRYDGGPRPVHRSTAQPGGASPREALPSIDHPQLVIPPIGIPRNLPSLDVAGSVLVGGTTSFPGRRSEGPITGSYLGRGAEGGGVLTPDAVEQVVALRGRAEPPYPAALRNSGVEGTVRVRFVVDTLGRVEPSSVDVRASAHDAFSDAVRAVLPRLRFAPARVAGRPVRQLVEMPFVFALTR